jgi:hypothetical protein
MANLKWLYALLSGNTETKSDSLHEPKVDDSQSNSQEFMFDSLMDVPFEPVDILWPCH